MLLSVLFAILMQFFAFSVAVRTWNYEFLYASVTSSDESKLNGSMTVERVSRGGSVLSASIDWNFDTDDTTEINMLTYHSQSGRNDDYHETPYRVKTTTFTEGVNKFYDEILYKNMGNCSNLEKISGKFVPPFPRKKYWARQCHGNTNGFPDTIPLGYYKVVVSITGQVDVVFTIILKLKGRY